MKGMVVVEYITNEENKTLSNSMIVAKKNDSVRLRFMLVNYSMSNYATSSEYHGSLNSGQM